MRIYERDSDALDKILQDFSEAAYGLRVLGRLNKIHNRPYKTLMKLSEQLIKIKEDITNERNNEA